MVHTSFLGFVKLVREDVKHKLTVALCVDMSVGFVVKEMFELWCVDEVAVVGKAYAIRTVYVEWLGLSIGTATRRWIPKMPDAHETWKILQTSPIVEDLGGHAISLALVYSSSSCT